MTRLNGVVQKGWGYELIWATNDKYCGKIMVFEKKGNKFSMGKLELLPSFQTLTFKFNFMF